MGITDTIREEIVKAQLGRIPANYFGYAESELSYRQLSLAIEFMKKTQPWLEANIGEFNRDWFVEMDKSVDSFRLSFKDTETETYFKLSWMQMNHEDD